MEQTVLPYIQWHVERAKESNEWEVRSIAHLITVDLLEVAYKTIRRNGATGTDKVTWEEYGRNLRENLTNLYERLKGQRYRAPAVKRVWIPKDDGQRPLGLPTLEDKVVQKAVYMLLEPIYEVDFKDCSYGFRRGRNAHQAITEIRNGCRLDNINWIIDADIRKCFDTIDHAKLQEVIRRRIADRNIRRLIGKWLNAGIMDGLELSYPESGTQQGSILSPLLANIYLHYVLDEWFVNEVQPRMKGNVFLVRYADDFVIGCEHQEDAERIMKVLPKRLEKYSLSIHPEKTKLVDFRVPTDKKGNTFNFLGFTLYWARSRKGNWVIKKRTIGKRKQRAIKRNNLWCKHHRHKPVKMQHERLCQKLQGYYNYFGVIGNYAAIAAVHHWTKCAWRKWLGRRGGKTQMTWERFNRLLETFPLPKPRIIHGI